MLIEIINNTVSKKAEKSWKSRNDRKKEKKLQKAEFAAKSRRGGSSGYMLIFASKFVATLSSILVAEMQELETK